MYFRYDDKKGRHVLASKSINVGDVLFVEKAFVFAPGFDAESAELKLDACYNCLRRTLNGIP